MKLVFMGTGGAGGPPGRAHNCILVETDLTRLVLDFGEACSWRLEELGLTLCDIDAVYVSHLHADHYGGLFDAAVRAIAYGCRKLTVAVAEPLAASMEEVIRTLPRSIASMATVLRIPVARPFRVNDVMLRLAPACHSIECYGVYVEHEGSYILYTGDTSPCPQLYEASPAGKAPKAVIHEAALPDHLADTAKRQGHSTPSQAITAVRERWPNTTIYLIHLSLETLRELARARSLPPNVVVPSDMTVASL